MTVTDAVRRTAQRKIAGLQTGLGDAECEVWPAVEQLYRRCSPEVLAEIAGAQNMRTTLTRLQDRLGERG